MKWKKENNIAKLHGPGSERLVQATAASVPTGDDRSQAAVSCDAGNASDASDEESDADAH